MVFGGISERRSAVFMSGYRVAPGRRILRRQRGAADPTDLLFMPNDVIKSAFWMMKSVSLAQCSALASSSASYMCIKM